MGRDKREGCLLVIVPDYVRDRFPPPRFNVTLGNRSYGIALPPGIVPDVASKWNMVFAKADRDPDFLREVRGSGLQVEQIARE
jgi:hypothetical protein